MLWFRASAAPAPPPMGVPASPPTPGAPAGADPSPAEPSPVDPSPAQPSLPAVPPPSPTTPSAPLPAADPTSTTKKSAYSAGQKVDVLWGGSWWQGQIVAVKNDKYLVHYIGWAASWDEWVTTARLRAWTGSARSK